MRKFVICLMLSCAGLLVACGPRASVDNGAGYALLTPSALTRNFMLTNDRRFAQQVAEHNLQCQKDKGCEK